MKKTEAFCIVCLFCQGLKYLQNNEGKCKYMGQESWKLNEYELLFQ